MIQSFPSEWFHNKIQIIFMSQLKCWHGAVHTHQGLYKATLILTLADCNVGSKIKFNCKMFKFSLVMAYY